MLSIKEILDVFFVQGFDENSSAPPPQPRNLEQLKLRKESFGPGKAVDQFQTFVIHLFVSQPQPGTLGQRVVQTKTQTDAQLHLDATFGGVAQTVMVVCHDDLFFELLLRELATVLQDFLRRLFGKVERWVICTHSLLLQDLFTLVLAVSSQPLDNQDRTLYRNNDCCS